MELPDGWVGGTQLEALGRRWQLDQASFQGFQYFVPNASVFMRFTFSDGAGLVLRAEGVNYLRADPGDPGATPGWSTLAALERTEAGRMRLEFAGGEVLEVGAEALMVQAV
jgi:hypothetical protein